MQLTSRSALALITLAALGVTARSATAQALTLGQNGTELVGAATLTNTGTTAAGDYTYDPTQGGLGGPLANQNNYFQLTAYGSSTATVLGGGISYFTLFNNSMANVSGGSVYQFETTGNSTAAVSGGNFMYLITYTTSAVTISGGSFYSISTNDSSTVTVSGGNIQNFVPNDSSILDILGTGLTETPHSSPHFSPNGSTVFTLTGTLLNGDPLDATYYASGGTLEFNGLPPAVPEASQTVSFGLLLALGMGGLVMASRRKKSAKQA